MATLAEVRARLRRALEDTDAAAALWSDAELNEDLAMAAREYGARFPRETTVTIAPVVGQTEYPLPAEVRRVVRVESPAGRLVSRRPARVAHEPGAAQSWAHFGGAIGFGLPPTDPIVARCRGLYPFPVSDAGDFGLPEEGIDLAILGAVLLALGRRETAAAKRRAGGGLGLALETARRRYAEALSRCRLARGDTLG